MLTASEDHVAVAKASALEKLTLPFDNRSEGWQCGFLFDRWHRIRVVCVCVCVVKVRER